MEAAALVVSEPERRGFIIQDIQKFTEYVLPRYFNHSNLSSFVRQLNMYGFKKSKMPNEAHLYYHQHFRIGNRVSLHKIRRRVGNPEKKSLQPTDSFSREMEQLKLRHVLLEQKCHGLISENRKLMDRNTALAQFLRGEGEKRVQIFGLLNEALSQQLVDTSVAYFKTSSFESDFRFIKS